MYCLFIFVPAAVLSKSGKIADWNRLAILPDLQAFLSKIRISCKRTSQTENNRKYHVFNIRQASPGMLYYYPLPVKTFSQLYLQPADSHLDLAFAYVKLLGNL